MMAWMMHEMWAAIGHIGLALEGLPEYEEWLSRY